MDGIVDCINFISTKLDTLKVEPGQITHTIAQLQAAFELQAQQLEVEVEKNFRTLVVPSFGGGGIDVNRNVDVFTEKIIQGVKTSILMEVKTGADLPSALDKGQLEQDAAIAIQKAFHTTSGEVANIWKLTNFDVTDPKTQNFIKSRIDDLRESLFAQEFSPEQVRKAIASFNFTDSLGNAVRTMINEEGQIIFEKPMQELFGPDGIVATSALHHTTSSPDFGPAMEALFGPSGKLATVAGEIANTANLEPALQGLEKKVETGIAGALDEAGDAAKGHSSESLGKQIGEGARALGTALTGVAMLSSSVKGLGEAWDKPLNSTQDYMNLFSAAGNTIMQGVQTFEAFANVTKIASAAQAVFNAVMAMNPIVLIIIAVIALIATIVLLIVYWDEVKLAVLKAANFISIEMQKIGHFFVGVGHLAGQVWDWIVAKLYNAGVSIINFFIKIGVDIQNFFIGIINTILGLYNKLASSVIGDVLGLKQAALIPQVDVATRLIPPKEVPKIDVHAAFTPAGDIKGGLEGAIAEQQGVIDRKKAEEANKQPQAAVPGVPAESGAVPMMAPALPSPGAGAAGGLARPALPGPGAPSPGAGGPIDQSVKVEGGITVNINAERLEANAAQLLSDEIIRRIQERLGSLRAEQDFRSGTRAAAPS